MREYVGRLKIDKYMVGRMKLMDSSRDITHERQTVNPSSGRIEIEMGTLEFLRPRNDELAQRAAAVLSTLHQKPDEQASLLQLRQGPTELVFTPILYAIFPHCPNLAEALLALLSFNRFLPV
jgi:hypothetical protein